MTYNPAYDPAVVLPLVRAALAQFRAIHAAERARDVLLTEMSRLGVTEFSSSAGQIERVLAWAEAGCPDDDAVDQEIAA